MEIRFKFEKLIIWQKAMGFGEEMNVLADDFPKKEIYNLSSQLRRASDSIALNISEGSIGQSEKKFKKFMGYAIRSLVEVITCLHKASRRNYISTLKFGQHYKDSFDFMNMMIAFKQKIK
jgi:four helix bundle protein